MITVRLPTYLITGLLQETNLISDKPALYFPCFELREPTPWDQLYARLPELLSIMELYARCVHIGLEGNDGQ